MDRGKGKDMDVREAELAAVSVLSSFRSSGSSKPRLLSTSKINEATRSDLLLEVEMELDALLSDLSGGEEHRPRRSGRTRRARAGYSPDVQTLHKAAESSVTANSTANTSASTASTTSSPLTSLATSPAATTGTSTPSSSASTSTSKRHACPHPSCPISTSRAADLRRHLLTHSTQQYTCSACGCAFGRKDGVGWHLAKGRCRGEEGGRGKRGRKGGRRK
ncbi:hypothetical protein CALVIDRAFT_564065 [Calocera viscosa TUFC12733]|uniref:C2H2-type domain-containing protein n=1 Tax=Calocera viscosa (strain TUFC12733) TaxID=1330018 RepID=A0A167LZ05_CALVF|nr:hypothetical protein CALVIDRAFT_564065 [Calocera viscosa TUFC12733]